MLFSDSELRLGMLVCWLGGALAWLDASSLYPSPYSLTHQSVVCLWWQLFEITTLPTVAYPTPGGPGAGVVPSLIAFKIVAALYLQYRRFSIIYSQTTSLRRTPHVLSIPTATHIFRDVAKLVEDVEERACGVEGAGRVPDQGDHRVSLALTRTTTGTDLQKHELSYLSAHPARSSSSAFVKISIAKSSQIS
jgi:hypothetical protein